jgi:sporulation protein YlmC with PRC-barrel domain
MMTTTWSPRDLMMVHAGDATVLASEDVRGMDVRDPSNERVGTVDDLVVDTSIGRVRFLKVGAGGLLGFGRHHWLVPVDTVTGIAAGSVFIDRARERLDDAPPWSDVIDEPYLDRVYRFYATVPFWHAGYRHPDWTRPA